MDTRHMEVRVERDLMRDLVLLHLVIPHAGAESRDLVTDMETETLEAREAAPEGYDAPLKLRRRKAQKLFDQLWDAGFRPSDGADPDGVVEAKDEHIDDLRRVLFGGSSDE